MTRNSFNLVLLSVALFIALAAAEIGVRVAGYFVSDIGSLLHDWDPYAVQIEPHGELGYRQRPNAVFHYYNGSTATSNAMGFRGPLVSADKPTGTVRILLLGGSATHGWGVTDEYTIDAYMRKMLAQLFPHDSFEVVNLAFDGYDAYQLFERLRTDGMRLDPELIILNTGINDVRNARISGLRDRDARTLIWEDVLKRLRKRLARGGPTMWTRTKHLLYVARLPGIVRNRLRGRSAAKHGREFSANPQAVDLFELNILRSDSLAAERGVPILLSTPPSALRDNFQPGDTSSVSYWLKNAQLTQEYRDLLGDRLRNVAARLHAAGRPIQYVPHKLEGSMFLDDAHLTAEGNCRMARDFVAAAIPYLASRLQTSSKRVARGTMSCDARFSN